jgi:two-component system nitrate/nitrite response regulator NarL
MTKIALIVEDHPLYRGALVHLLKSILGERGTREASSAEAGLRLASELPNLNLILLDLNLPGMSGMEALAAFHSIYPNVPLLVISAIEDRQEAMRVLRAGASVFLSKEVSTDVMSEVVHGLLANALTTPQWITASSRIQMDDGAQGRRSGATLTQRQLDVLRLLQRGLSNKEIALHMDLAEATIKIHVSAVFRSLGVVNRTQAVLAARRLGLVDDSICRT